MNNIEMWELSHPQQRILITHLLHENIPVCNIGGYAFFDGDVDCMKLKKAIFETICLFDCFSIKLHNLHGHYMQSFSIKEPSVNYCEEFDGDEASLRRYAQEAMSRPFSLEDEQLYRIIIWSGKCCAGYVLILHHIICDGWSVNLFAESVSNCYKGNTFSVNSYTDFLKQEQEYLHSEVAKKDGDYWRQFLEIHQFKWESKENQNKCNGWREEFHIDGDFKTRLKLSGEKCGDINTVLCSCFALMDYLEGGNGVIGIPCYNRPGKKMRQTPGMFTSTMMAALIISPDEIVQEISVKMRCDLLNAIRHQRWPYDCLNVSSQLEPFRYTVNCYNTNLKYPLGTVVGNYNELYPGVQAVPFQMILNLWKDDWVLQFDLREDYFHQGDGQKFILFLDYFLNSLLKENRQTIYSFKEDWEANIFNLQRGIEHIPNFKEYSFQTRINQLIDPVDKEEIAIIIENEMIGRGKLACYISGAMQVYKDAGLSTGESVVVWMANGLKYVVYAIAAAVMGIRFTPVDIMMPKQQVCLLCKDANVKALVTEKTESINNFIGIVPEIYEGNSMLFLPKIEEDMPLYLLYTSGSTGKPKGVLISRQSMGAYLNWAEAYYGAKHTFFLYSSPSFDLSLTTLFLPLTSKGKLVISQEERPALYQLPSLQYAKYVDAIKGTPTNLSLLLSKNTDNLKLKVIICGGEDLSTALAEQLQLRFGFKCKIYNEYGPTECTVGCMCSCYGIQDSGKSVSLGKAAPGCHVYIVKDGEKLCAPGEAGEIYLSGKQLSKGYWNLTQETKNAFLEDRFGEERVYRTGDIARYDSDGRAFFLGRIGRQIKVNGYRVELDSIETFIKNINGIINAAAWVEKEEMDYLIVAVETTVCTKEEIYASMEGQLSPYHIPHKIYLHDSFPITVNGKINIMALKEEARDIENDRSAMNTLEQILCDILHYQGEMEDFNFILAGGDSVRAIRVISALQQKGYSLSLMDLLNHPHFNEMIKYVHKKTFNAEKQRFQIPKHIKYLAETCEDFSNYYHIIKVKIHSGLSEEQISELYTKLLYTFPSLNMVIKMGFLEFNDIHSPMLFSLSEESVDEQCIIKISIHHVLIDGVSWVQLLNTIYGYVERRKIEKRPLIEIWKLDDEITYQWSQSSYTCLSEVIEEEVVIEAKEVLDIISFLDVVRETIGQFPNMKNTFLLCDWDGRKLVSINRPDNIGCYSILLPIQIGKESTEEQIIHMIRSKKIIIPSKVFARVNYLGNFDELIPSGLELLPESLVESRGLCSAWGSDYEITGYIHKKKFHLIVGTRIEKNRVYIMNLIRELEQSFQNYLELDFGFSMNDLE